MKQASRIWYLLLCKTITNYGFEQLISDQCIFISSERHIIIAVYVDDILIISPDPQECQMVYDYLAQHFQMNNLSEPTTFLGLNVSRNWQKRTITINQAGYINRLLKRFQMESCIPISTPLNRSLPLRKRQPYEKSANHELYQELTGSLMHLAVYSHPDIAFAVSKLSQFNNDPSQTHLKAARHVLRYLKKIHEFSITYGGQTDGLNFKGYADASHASDLDGRKSTTGYTFLINNGPVLWASYKQSTVATSTMEAEYMALSDAAHEAIACSYIFEELGIEIPAPAILCDCQPALAIVDNPTNYQ